MRKRGELTRRLVWILALVAVATAGAALVPALRSLSEAGAPLTQSAASDLVHEYPLGERPLCCSQKAAARAPASQVTAPSGADAGDRTLWPLAAVPVLVALAMLGWGSQRFTRKDGYWVRTRPRRRWTIGPRVHRVAQAVGFRYSHARDALVLRVRGGNFGPVLKLQSTIHAAARPEPERIGMVPDVTPARPWIRPAVRVIGDARHTPVPTRSTVDVACLPHPYSPPGIWQLTAVELHSGFTWAKLVQRRSGRPTAQQIAAFLRAVADDLAAADRRLATLVMHDPPPLLFEPDVLPSDVMLLAPAKTAGRSRPAAAVHELLFQHHRRAALLAPTASFVVLQRQLQRWVAAHNAEHGTALAWPAARTHGS